MLNLKLTMFLLIGLALSTMLLVSCSPRPEALPPPPVVITLKDTPPAELLACPQPPDAMPTGIAADMPAPVRAGLIRLALAYRAGIDQLERLISWNDPEHPCDGGRIHSDNSDPPGAPINLLPPPKD